MLKVHLLPASLTKLFTASCALMNRSRFCAPVAAVLPVIDLLGEVSLAQMRAVETNVKRMSGVEVEQRQEVGIWSSQVALVRSRPCYAVDLVASLSHGKCKYRI